MLNLMCLVAAAALAAAIGPVPTRVEKNPEGWRLLRAGKPYLIKGGGGDYSMETLVACGGNSVRTWGAEGADKTLDEAQKLGATVTVGIWLGHKEAGFRYDDPKQVQEQFERAKSFVLRYRNHPALLMWGLGNEMEGFDGKDDPNVWHAVEAIAKMTKELDPNHPTMTVVAEITPAKLASIKKYCPDIDVVGINSYGGAPSIPERYRKEDVGKPYVLTEFGAVGWWESGKTAWGAPLEPSSTQKAEHYRESYEKAVLGAPGLCLGSYAFVWGYKQEATSTWFGMFLPDGSKVGAVDVIQELWTGKRPKDLCPRIQKLAIDGPVTVAPGATIHAQLQADDPDGDALTAKWELIEEATVRGIGGSPEPKPTAHQEAVLSSSAKEATIKMPQNPVGYRLFVTVYDGNGGAATANVPLKVQ